MNALPLLLRRAHRLLRDNSPVILTSIGVAGVVGTAILAVRATPEALRRIENAEMTKVVEDDSIEYQTVKIGVIRKIALVWPLYVPAVLSATASIAAIIGSNSINTRRNAAVLSAFTLAESRLMEYRDKVIQLDGRKKDDKVLDAIAEDKIQSRSLEGREVIITGNGDFLCHDSLSDRYFLSTQEKIKAAVNEINFTCIHDMYASQNDFYRLIGLPPIEFGEELGWSVDEKMEIRIVSHLSSDGRPCISIDYKTQPHRKYYKTHG